MSNIYKYGNDVIWSLPCLFQYEIILGAFQNSLEDLGFEKLKANAYGSPATIWSSGRPPVVRKEIEKPQMKKLFNYVKDVNNGIPTFTFSRIDITDEDLKDPYANYILDFGIEYGARFIVASDNLKNYIKGKSPETPVVASILKSIYRFQGKDKLEEPTVENETNYYNKLLKEYDFVVVRPEYSKTTLVNNPSLINDIKRVEVLINQLCYSSCPNAPMHNSTHAKQHTEATFTNPHLYCYKNLYPISKQYQLNSAHTFEEVTALINAGVRQLKLQGRGEAVPYMVNAFTLASQIFNFDGPNMFLFQTLIEKLRQEYSRFFSIIDKERDWYFPDSDLGLFPGKQDKNG